MRQYETTHLVKSEDMNHHGTLFAARAASWLVEAAFVAAGCACGSTEGLVCRSINDMSFYRPVQKGTILKFLTRVVYAGKSSFMVAVTAVDALSEIGCEQSYIEGLLTFVTVDENGHKSAHHIKLDEPEDAEECRLRKLAVQKKMEGVK